MTFTTVMLFKKNIVLEESIQERRKENEQKKNHYKLLIRSCVCQNKIVEIKKKKQKRFH